MLSGDIFVSVFIINPHGEITQISAHLVIISNYQLKLISNLSVMDGLVVFKYSERNKSNFMHHRVNIQYINTLNPYQY
jgi:hypothetical protein